MRVTDKLISILLAMCGESGADLESDFDDDGYTDFWGRADINEPLFISDINRAPEISIVRGGVSAELNRRA